MESCALITKYVKSTHFELTKIEIQSMIFFKRSDIVVWKQKLLNGEPGQLGVIVQNPVAEELRREQGKG